MVATILEFEDLYNIVSQQEFEFLAQRHLNLEIVNNRFCVRTICFCHHTSFGGKGKIVLWI